MSNEITILAALPESLQASQVSLFRSPDHKEPHSPVDVKEAYVSMYSQAHISLFNIYWRVWLLVIREVEKTSLGSLEALC